MLTFIVICLIFGAFLAAFDEAWAPAALMLVAAAAVVIAGRVVPQ